MELQYIPDLACPICGNTVIIKEAIESDGKTLLKHSNGETWEIRAFACGQALAYIPNFRRVERSDYAVCHNDPQIHARQQQWKATVAAITDYIATLPSDPRDLRRFTEAITDLRCPWKP